MALKTPTSVMVAGTISVARMKKKKNVRPRNWYFDRAKAAIELMVSVMIVASIVARNELVKQRAKLTVTIDVVPARGSV